MSNDAALFYSFRVLKFQIISSFFQKMNFDTPSFLSPGSNKEEK